MKLLFLLIAILINFFNIALIKSEEKFDSKNNKIENTAKNESFNENKDKKRIIHIVKSGDTLSSISKLYSIKKDLIIKLNNLKDQNFIYVGQNLIITESTENALQKSNFKQNYHVVLIGETLTEISNKYKLNLGYLIDINNLENPDSLEVGEKILLSKNSPISSENYQMNKNNEELFESKKLIYGPLTIENKSFKKIEGKTILNVLNQANKKLILSINCFTNELDVRIPGRKWSGAKPAKEEFEKDLINDFCSKF
ncbi:LysM domain-containing protein [uncultured Prochlorococcus sp.]|uniref:LysM peptidoglycan-binding domain-containing protein n=1 Tax=uncultured Prochlorococcus sp. TaxID=159733 RepID=UPI00258A0508|nr:LysM domain-containing protein [uncultured Prochlorococcus sp.]